MTVETWALRETPKLTDEQFVLWQTLLEERTGMQIPAQRKIFLETSIAMRMRELGLEDFDVYYQRLMNGLAGEVEWSTLVDRLTVQETSFFRAPSSLALVEQHVRRHFAENPDKRRVEIWSVGCSTGEEPYTLAMTMDRLVSDLGGGRYFGVVANDLSLPALSKARQGIYAARKVENIADDVREKYFEATDKGRYKVRASLRERVCFARLNVMDLAASPMRDMDVIYCQNMLIYFRQEHKKQIVGQLAERLAPGGLLVIGVGELLDFSHPLVVRCPADNTLAFIRRD